MVYTYDLGSYAARRGGSSPLLGTVWRSEIGTLVNGISEIS
jgi:hypothetical protein